jgi:mRNA interferase HigB
MKIGSRDRLTAAARTHPNAAGPLLAWITATEAANWRNLKEVRDIFRHADAVKVESGRTVTIFNIGGNKYRLLTAVSYPISTVNVLALLTHAEYDKEKWKKTL